MAYFIDTLQKLKDHDYILWASCSSSDECWHFASLDMDLLIDRFGPDFDFVEDRARLVASLSCSKCGRKGIEVRLAARDTSGAGTQGSTVW